MLARRRRPSGPRRRFPELWDGDLGAVLHSRGEIDGDQVGVGLRPPRPGKRILGTRTGGEVVHAGFEHFSSNVHDDPGGGFRRCGAGTHRWPGRAVPGPSVLGGRKDGSGVIRGRRSGWDGGGPWAADRIREWRPEKQRRYGRNDSEPGQ